MTNWFNDRGYFVKHPTCASIKKYIKEQLNVDAEIHKTSTYLVINYVVGGLMRSEKVKLPSEVLYCLQEKHFAELFEKVRNQNAQASLKGIC